MAATDRRANGVDDHWGSAVVHGGPTSLAIARHLWT
jgi:hypothetical protein